MPRLRVQRALVRNLKFLALPDGALYQSNLGFEDVTLRKVFVLLLRERSNRLVHLIGLCRFLRQILGMGGIFRFKVRDRLSSIALAFCWLISIAFVYS